MKLPGQKEEVETYFIASDLHSIFLHIPSFKIMQKHAWSMKEKPSLVINGDLYDLPFMMKKNPNFKKWIKRSDGCEEFFIPEFEKECNAVNEILDALQAVFKKIIWVQGNHDSLRIKEFKEMIPNEYRPHFNYRDKLRIKKRGITVIDYGVWLDIGKVSIIHGMYHNKQSAKSHHEECGKNVIYGHIHKAGMTPFKQRGETHHVWSLPCLCTLSPDYMRKRTNDWDNGYGILNVKGDGNFNFNIFIVRNNEVILSNGEIIHE